MTVIQPFINWLNQPFRLIAAPFTPMKHDGNLNLEVIPPYLDFLTKNKIHGAFINGSTGEGVSMSLEEKKASTLAWINAKQPNSDIKIINLVGGTSLVECKELARFSADKGIDAIAIIAPFYFKPDAKLLAEFIREVAAEVPDTPVYFYHIPVLTNVCVSMFDLLNEIDGTCPNFVGIKYTHEDFMDYLSCINFADKKYDILWGRDENLLPALSVGAKGTVGSTYNYLAPLYQRMLQNFNENKLSEAVRLQQLSIDFIRLLGKYGGIATGKAYMKMIGMDCGQFRLPVKNMSTAEFKEFENEVESLGFAEYCSKNS